MHSWFSVTCKSRKLENKIINHSIYYVKKLRYCRRVINKQNLKVSGLSDIPYSSYSAKCTTQITELSIDAPWWSPSEGLQYGGRKRVKTSGIYFGYLKGFLLPFELQTSKRHAESMFSCTWHACEQTSLCHGVRKNLKFKLLYFQNKARYRAENMQEDTFLKCLLRDEAKNGKVSLLLNFTFFVTSRENQEYWRQVCS